MGNLVSDEDSTGVGTNRGVTLPTGEGATHNGALSPLFLLRSGVTRTAVQNAMIYCGQTGYLWSANSINDQSSRRFILGEESISPSQSSNQNDALSLRCLVSKSQASE